jgi:hypothetical protein
LLKRCFRMWLNGKGLDTEEKRASKNSKPPGCKKFGLFSLSRGSYPKRTLVS